MKIAALITLLCLCGSAFGDVVPASLVVCLVTSSSCNLGSSFFSSFSSSSTIQFSSSTFLGISGLSGKTINLAPTSSIGSIVIDSGVAANFVISGAVTSVASAGQAALSVGSSAVVNVTGTLQTTGDVIVEGVFNAVSGSSVNIKGNFNSTSASSSSSAQINLAGSSSVSVSGAVDVNAIINVAAAATFKANNDFKSRANATVYGSIAAANYYQNQATLRLQTTSDTVVGAVTAANVYIQSAATFSGNGNINGNLNVDGNVAVGNSPGTSYVNGDYRMSGTSTYTCDVASDSSFDRLIITGTAYLDGIAVVNLENNYRPNGRTVYNTFTHKAVSGRFNIVRGTTFSDLAGYSASYGSTQTALVANSAIAVAFSASLLLVSLVVSLM